MSTLIKLINLPKISDDAFLHFAQFPDHIPFPIKRVYYITQPKASEPRGYHAHHSTEQILFCIQGSVRMVLDNGHKREEYLLNRSEQGIYLGKMIWHEMHDMGSDTILLVLTSDIYKPGDYIRSYEQFKRVAQQSHSF